MIHIHSLDEVRPDRPTLLTIGAFDGVHRGHQALVADLAAAAHARDWRAAVLTFYPHPSVVLRGRQPAFYISRPEEKAELLAELGVDITITQPFNLEESKVTAADFVRRLHAALDFRELWAGADFALGHNREGTIDWLQEHGPEFGFSVRVKTPVVIDGEVVSSSRVRRALRAGNVEKAARLLGRPLRVPGTVVEGERRDRTIGVPTANLAIWDERAYPAPGGYACYAHVGGNTYQATTNIGFRPTFDGAADRPTIEVHLLDFDGDIYEQKLSLDFIARLRPEVKFEGIERLAAQIQADIAKTREMLFAFETAKG